MPTNRSRLPRTPLALAVLNLLTERPMHPYEMKSLMRERGHDRIVKIRGGSVYDTVERLQALGFVEALETSREGRRPERTVYALTGIGRDELKSWMEELLARPVNDYPQFAAALAFMVSVQSRESVVSLLTGRVMALESEIAASEVTVRATVQDFGVPRIFVIEEEYGQAMRRAELDWVRNLIRELKEGDLWPDQATLDRLLEEQKSRQEGGET